MDIFGNILTVILAVVFGALGLAMFVGLYFLPSIFAFRRNHPSKAAVLILNIFLGWTFLGWVVSLVWAFTDTRRS